MQNMHKYKLNVYKVFIVCIFSLIVLNVFDLITTGLIIKSGIGYEWNPIVKTIIDSYGLTGLCIIKQCVSILLLLILSSSKLTNTMCKQPWLLNLLVSITIIYFIVVLRSFIMLGKGV